MDPTERVANRGHHGWDLVFNATWEKLPGAGFYATDEYLTPTPDEWHRMVRDYRLFTKYSGSPEYDQCPHPSHVNLSLTSDIGKKHRHCCKYPSELDLSVCPSSKSDIVKFAQYFEYLVARFMSENEGKYFYHIYYLGSYTVVSIAKLNTEVYVNCGALRDEFAYKVPVMSGCVIS